MGEVSADRLPSVRIHCQKGRIRVGDRHFLSASQALAVYLQQFETPQRLHATAGGSPVSNFTMRDAPLHSCSSPGDSSVSFGTAGPDRVVPVLTTDNPVSFGEKGMNSTHNHFSPVNVEFIHQHSPEQKVAVPDRIYSTSQQYTMQPDLAFSPTNSATPDRLYSSSQQYTMQPDLPFSPKNFAVPDHIYSASQQCTMQPDLPFSPKNFAVPDHSYSTSQQCTMQPDVPFSPKTFAVPDHIYSTSQQCTMQPDVTFSPKNSAVPDHIYSTSKQYTMQPNLACSLKNSEQTFSAINGKLERNSSPYHDPHQPVSLSSHQHCHSSSALISTPPEPTPVGKVNGYDSSHEQSRVYNKCGPQVSHNLTNPGQKVNGMMDFLDFHSSVGAPFPGSHHEWDPRPLFTAMPSHRELKQLAEDVVREVKMKRLMKVVKAAPSSSPVVSSNGAVLPEVLMREGGGGGGERSRKEEMKEKWQVKGVLKEAAEKESSHSLPQPSALQQEVDEALSRSAQLLKDLKSSKLVTTPRRASDVTGHHSADILLSSTPTSTDPQLPSARASRSRHRYSYRTHALRSRSLSLDGNRPRPEPLSSDDAASCYSNIPTSRSLADCLKFRSLDNLPTSCLDDSRPPRSVDSLKPAVLDRGPSPPARYPKPVSWADIQQFGLLGGPKTHSVSATRKAGSTECLGSSLIDEAHQGPSAESPITPSAFLGERELWYLKKGTSVLSDCEDLLRELQAVNPPSLPDLSLSRRKSSNTQNIGVTDDFSGLTPVNGHLVHLKKAKESGVEAPPEFTSLQVDGATRDESPSRMKGFKSSGMLPDVHIQDLSIDAVPMMELKRTSSVPCVNTFLIGSERTLDDSSFADFSYTGPGLSYSDLVSSPVRSKPPTSPNDRADLPPKPPHRLSRHKNGNPGKDGESISTTSAKNDPASSGRTWSTTNPVLQDLADILDTIDLNPVAQTETTLTLSPEIANVHYAADRTVLSACSADAAKFRKMCTPGAAGLEEAGAAIDKGQRLSGAMDGNITASLSQGGQNGHCRTPPRPNGLGLPTLHPSLSVDCSATSKESSSMTNHVDLPLVTGQRPVSKKVTLPEEKETDEAAELLPALKGYHFELEPGGQSLEKALVHLGRLKSLVQTPAPHHTTATPPAPPHPHIAPPATDSSQPPDQSKNSQSRPLAVIDDH